MAITGCHWSNHLLGTFWLSSLATKTYSIKGAVTESNISDFLLETVYKMRRWAQSKGNWSAFQARIRLRILMQPGPVLANDRPICARSWSSGIMTVDRQMVAGSKPPQKYITKFHLRIKVFFCGRRQYRCIILISPFPAAWSCKLSEFLSRVVESLSKNLTLPPSYLGPSCDKTALSTPNTLSQCPHYALILLMKTGSFNIDSLHQLHMMAAQSYPTK